MKKLEKVKSGFCCLLLMLVVFAVLTACGSKAATAADKIELGQKYLTELNYTEAVASFTEAIKLDPDNIQAYMGRAEAYMALGEYDKALADYRFVSGKTEDMPYTRALSYIGQAEAHEKMEQPARAVSDYGLAKALLKASDAGKAENVSEEDVSAKLVQVLYVHAALCETLTNYNTALEDYNDLLELGENTAAKRDEVLSQLGGTAEDENGLTDAEEPSAESTAEEPAEEPTEEPAPEQETASESTASSVSTASGEAASSNTASSNAESSETPAESPSVSESASSKDTAGNNEKQGIRAAVLKEINEFRAKAGMAPVILDCAHQNELDEIALNLKITNDSRIDGSTLSDEEMEKITQRNDELDAVLSQIDSYVISYDSGFLIGNPEYTKVSIGVNKGKHGAYNGNYLVVLYY